MSAIGIHSGHDFTLPALYSKTMDQYTSLSKEDEFDLAVRLYEKGDLEAAEKLVLSQLRFVTFMARKFLNYGLPFQDLMQEGLVGLMKAVKSFNPYEETRLITFAVYWIKAEIYEYIIKNWRIVKIATTKAQRKLFFNLRSMKNDDEQWISEYRAEQIAEELQVPVKEVIEMERRMYGSELSLTPDDENESWLSPLVYMEQPNADPAIIYENINFSQDQLTNLDMAIQTLDARDQDIIQKRWLNENKSTLHELSITHGVSLERIRQLENKAIQKLHKRLLSLA